MWNNAKLEEQLGSTEQWTRIYIDQQIAYRQMRALEKIAEAIGEHQTDTANIRDMLWTIADNSSYRGK